MLLEFGLLGCKPEPTLVDPSLDMWDESSKEFEVARQYRRLVGKLIFLTVTWSDTAYVVGLVSQIMHKSRLVH